MGYQKELFDFIEGKLNANSQSQVFKGGFMYYADKDGKLTSTTQQGLTLLTTDILPWTISSYQATTQPIQGELVDSYTLGIDILAPTHQTEETEESINEFRLTLIDNFFTIDGVGSIFLVSPLNNSGAIVYHNKKKFVPISLTVFITASANLSFGSNVIRSIGLTGGALTEVAWLKSSTRMGTEVTPTSPATGISETIPNITAVTNSITFLHTNTTILNQILTEGITGTKNVYDLKTDYGDGSTTDYGNGTNGIFITQTDKVNIEGMNIDHIRGGFIFISIYTKVAI